MFDFFFLRVFRNIKEFNVHALSQPRCFSIDFAKCLFSGVCFLMDLRQYNRFAVCVQLSLIQGTRFIIVTYLYIIKPNIYLFKVGN